MPATSKRFAACRYPHRIAVQPLKTLTVCAAFALLAVPAGGHAQNSPGAADAQELIRQQQRERQLRDRFERSPDIRLDAPSAAIAAAARRWAEMTDDRRAACRRELERLANGG